MMRNRNIIAGIVLLGIGLGYGVLTSQLPVRTLPHTPDPSFFPWLNTGFILVLAAALLLQAYLARENAEESIDGISPGRSVIVALTLGAFFLYVIVLPIAGFLLATIPFFAILMLLFGERRPVWVASGSILLPVLLFVVFRHGFGVFLPRGPMPGVLG